MLKRALGLFGVAIILLTQIMLGYQKTEYEELKSYAIQKIELQTNQMIEASDAIWEYAEIALLEVKSSKLLADIA